MNDTNKDKFVIEGLGGKKTLNGSVEVMGAKNAALKALAGTVLFDNGVILENIPNIEDIGRMMDLLEYAGASVDNLAKGKYKVFIPETCNTNLNKDIAKKMRSSVVLVGPILARFGKVSFPHPGGCVIGERPVDLFLTGFRKMGAKIRKSGDKYVLNTPKGKLKGAEIFFDIVSVTATETMMLAAVLAQGRTVLKNAALEPEIESLAMFLNHSGAKISGAGTSTIIIDGGGLLHTNKNFTYRTPPDRIEAGSFLILGALCAKNLKIKNCDPSHMGSLINLLQKSGVNISVGEDHVKVANSPSSKSSTFKSLNIKTHEYPGFPTDLQAPMSIFLTQVSGESLVFETIFEGRLSYAEALTRMGADIKPMDTHRIIIKGPSQLKGKELESPDLRAGLAYIIAASVANGRSIVHNVYNIDRGYERIEERLSNIGLNINRENT